MEDKGSRQYHTHSFTLTLGKLYTTQNSATSFCTFNKKGVFKNMFLCGRKRHKKATKVVQQNNESQETGPPTTRPPPVANMGGAAANWLRSVEAIQASKTRENKMKELLDASISSLEASSNKPLSPGWMESERKTFQEKYTKKSFDILTPPPKLGDFSLLTTLGTGSLSRVILVQHKVTQEYCAMKILSKAKVVKLRQTRNVLNEKKILACLTFPFTVHLKYSFKDNANLYLVTDYVEGGELCTYLRRQGRLPESESLFYASQVVLILEYLHGLDLIYRDVKPENLLLDPQGYIKLTDFGYTKQVRSRTYTLCGTPEYLAPEVILSKGYNHAADWWAFGVLLFELTAGVPPFFGESPMATYEKISAGVVQYPRHFSSGLVDICKNLLVVDVSKRFGNLKKGVEDIKRHSWFSKMNWNALFHKRVKAPYVPVCPGGGDTSNFETYEEETLLKSWTEVCGAEFAEF